MKQTIAFMGDAGKACPDLMKRLANADLQLLLVADHGEEFDDFSQKLAKEATKAEVELINCPQNGCWEADIIAFIDPGTIEEEILKRIKSVATQKIVLVVCEQEDNSASAEKLQENLPHSKVVWVQTNTEATEAKIGGADTKAVASIASIFEKAGYNRNFEI